MPTAKQSLITPEMLVLMLDQSLVRLGELVEAAGPAEPLPRELAWDRERETGCRCGLHLLNAYYRSGAQALQETLPADFKPDPSAVLGAFNRMGHDEVKALCGLCRFRGGPQCSLPEGQLAGELPGRP